MTAAVAEIAGNREAIDQTKGMLLMTYGIGAHTAFELLKWRSQQTNMKLRTLADNETCHPGRRREEIVVPAASHPVRWTRHTGSLLRQIRRSRPSAILLRP